MGPLQGVRVLEIAGIGPGPFAAMMLSDMGAEVLRIDRTAAVRQERHGVPGDLLNRGRQSVAVDLKHPEGVATVLRLVEEADALLEGFRPGFGCIDIKAFILQPVLYGISHDQFIVHYQDAKILAYLL